MSILPHAITLEKPDGERVDANVNVFTGTVTRQTYLGTHRDYLVAVNQEVSLRVVTPPSILFRPGDQVRLVVRAEDCWPIGHGR